MAKGTIEIEIAPDGSVEIDAVGFKGADCEKATKAYEDALGGKVTATRKPEFYQTTGTKERA